MTPIRVESGIRLEPLADHVDLIPTIASWHVPDARGALFEFWQTQLEREAGRAGVPSVCVALEDDAPIGSASLVGNNLPTRPELGPWLAGVYVIRRWRRRGIGTALVRRCEKEARSAGVARLYLHTSSAEHFYERLDWVRFDQDRDGAESVVIMTRDLR